MDLLGYPIAISNTLGMFSFLSFIVFFILYFLKPKPVRRVIPSLIFIESQKKKSMLAGIFGRIVKDWLFLVQFLLLLLLCFSALGPYTFLEMATFNQETVFVIDASASSKAYEEGRSRFDRAIDYAKQNLGLLNSIVLAKGAPNLLAKKTNPVNAARLLSQARPVDSGSNIWDAMLMAGDLADQGKIIVLSDFKDTNGKDPHVAKDILESKGFQVELINLAKSNNNVGFVAYNVNADSVDLQIKNFGDEEKGVNVNGNGLIISPKSIEQITLPFKAGINTYHMDVEDALQTDNDFSLYIPETKESRVLVLTNRKNTFVQDALNSIPGLEIETAVPPIIPAINHDLVVLDQADNLLSGTYEDLKKFVSEGGALVITASNNLPDLADLVPITSTRVENSSTPVVNTLLFSELEDINFEQSCRFHNALLSNNNTVILGETIEEVPVITYTKFHLGSIMYYGIFDDCSNFKFSTEYPIFWFEMVRKLTGTQPLEMFNLAAGEIIKAESIRDPAGTKHENYAVAEHVGIYTVDDKKAAVNLLNPIESDIGSDYVSEVSDTEKRKTLQRFDLLPIVIGLAIILLFFDLYVIKRRGDL